MCRIMILFFVLTLISSDSFIFADEKYKFKSIKVFSGVVMETDVIRQRREEQRKYASEGTEYFQKIAKEITSDRVALRFHRLEHIEDIFYVIQKYPSLFSADGATHVKHDDGYLYITSDHSCLFFLQKTKWVQSSPPNLRNLKKVE